MNYKETSCVIARRNDEAIQPYTVFSLDYFVRCCAKGSAIAYY